MRWSGPRSRRPPTRPEAWRLGRVTGFDRGPAIPESIARFGNGIDPIGDLEGLRRPACDYAKPTFAVVGATRGSRFQPSWNGQLIDLSQRQGPDRGRQPLLEVGRTPVPLGFVRDNEETGSDGRAALLSTEKESAELPDNVSRPRVGRGLEGVLKC